VTLATINRCPVISPAIGIEQFLKQTATYPVRCGANGHFACLQVHVALLPDISKNPLHKPIYFPLSFPANRFCNFF
jgi:hypothetical protein